MLNPCWSNTKRFLSVLVVFGKYFVFTKIVKISKNSVALFWRLSRGLVQSHAPVASPHKDFSRLTGESMSQSRKILRIFFKNLGFYVSRGSIWRLVCRWKVQSRGVHRDFPSSPRDSLAGRLSSCEKQRKFLKFLVSRFLTACFGDLHATWFSRENRVFCISRVIFMVVFKNFSFFPHASLSLFIPSSLALFSHWPLCLFVSKRGRVYYFLCTFVGGEILFLVHICRGEIHYTCPFITCYTLRV